jgi:pantothenate kinase
MTTGAPEAQTPEQLATLIPAPTSTRVVIGLAGPPGTGKSTAAAALVATLNQRDGDVWAVLGMDGFHLSNAVLIADGKRDRKGAFDTFDVAGFVAALRRVRSDLDTPIYLPVFHREIEESYAAEGVIGPRVRGLVVEGNYLLLDHGGWEHVRALLDACWFVESDAAVRRERLVTRAAATYGSFEAGQRWVDQVDEPNGRLIDATRQRADRVIRVANLGGS